MTEPLRIVDEGRKGWLSWIVARDHSARSSRHRLDCLLPRLQLLGNGAWGQPIGESWLEIDRADAELRAHNFATTGIVYALSRPWRPEILDSTARTFFDRFVAETRVFTNWDWCPYSQTGSSFCTWDPISQSTFDMAFGLTDGELVGIFCVEDED